AGGAWVALILGIQQPTVLLCPHLRQEKLRRLGAALHFSKNMDGTPVVVFACTFHENRSQPIPFTGKLLVRKLQLTSPVLARSARRGYVVARWLFDLLVLFDGRKRAQPAPANVRLGRRRVLPAIPHSVLRFAHLLPVNCPWPWGAAKGGH